MTNRYAIFGAALILGIIFIALAPARAQQNPANSQLPPAANSQTAPATKTPNSQGAKPAPSPEAKKPAAPADKQTLSYAIGMNIARGMKAQAIEASDLDIEALARGLKDALAGNKTTLTDDQVHETLGAFSQEIRERQKTEHDAAVSANKAAGDAFLAENKTKDGVVALPDGLQYKIITAGTGAKPTVSDTVVCNYRGTLLDGKEFDSSAKHGQPASFPVGRVIKGWTEALQLMPVGSKWQLFIPSDLAYGDRGAPPDIGPNATLIFEVELLSIKETPAPGPKPTPPKPDSE